jgi:ribonucleotide monophosphatase NagD (HAD superfamily)
LRYTGWSKEEVLIVGDNLYTDILCGIQAGVKSALVLTGISKREDVEKTGIKPDIIVESMMDLFEIL